MKKLLMLAVVLLGAATMAQAQEREKKILDLKNGQEVAGYVMRQQDGSWMVETESGDTFFYAADEVAAVRKEGEAKTVARVATQAGDAGTYDAYLVRKGGKLINAETNMEVRPRQLPGMLYSNYYKMKKKYQFGLWMTPSGVAAMTVGTGILIGMESTIGVLVSGSVLTALGLGSAIWGIVDLCVGITGLDKIATEYNVGYADNVKISFGAQQYGYGLAIKF